MTTETVRVDGPRVTVDLLLWRRYRRPTPGLAEKVLELNPGLASSGPFIPAGTVVALPGPEAAGVLFTREIVELWS